MRRWAAGFKDATEFYSAFTLIENLVKFFGGEAVTQADYQGTVNKIRF